MLDVRRVYRANVKNRSHIFQELLPDDHHERASEADETEGQEIAPTIFGKTQRESEGRSKDPLIQIPILCTQAWS